MNYKLQSKICNQEDFETEWFNVAYEKLGSPKFNGGKYHRKFWEWCYIYHALNERGVLKQGNKGLGFGVGKEPLVSLFASHNSELLASDLDFVSAMAKGWATSNQHASNMSELNQYGLCDNDKFNSLVSLTVIDMNRIPTELHGKFDFTWSSCSFEHLGSIELGKQFIIEQMKCLKEGGIAVHTTEYNLSSNTHTIGSGDTVLFRKRDIEDMASELVSLGYDVEVDFKVGEGEIDRYIDLPPYINNPHHLRLKISQYDCTSIGLIIKK